MELCAAEYYNRNPQTYLSTINNFKLLIDIIGPEPVIKLLFRGDDDELLRIIKTNLPEKQSARLLVLLDTESKKLSDKNVALHSEVRELLCELYKTINKKDIRENPEIMYSFFYENEYNDVKLLDSAYLNVKKMKDVEHSNSFIIDLQDSIDSGIIQLQQFVIAIKDVTNIEEYNELSKEETIKLNPYYIFDKDSMLYGIIDYKKHLFYELDSPAESSTFKEINGLYVYDNSKVKGKYISFMEAFEKGYVGIKATTTFSQSDFEKDENIANKWTSIITKMKYVSNNPNIVLPSYYGHDDKIVISIQRPGLKVRFKEQYENLYNIVSQLDYSESKSLS